MCIFTLRGHKALADLVSEGESNAIERLRQKLLVFLEIVMIDWQFGLHMGYLQPGKLSTGPGVYSRRTMLLVG